MISRDSLNNNIAVHNGGQNGHPPPNRDFDSASSGDELFDDAVDQVDLALGSCAKKAKVGAPLRPLVQNGQDLICLVGSASSRQFSVRNGICEKLSFDTDTPQQQYHQFCFLESSRKNQSENTIAAEFLENLLMKQINFEKQLAKRLGVVENLDETLTPQKMASQTLNVETYVDQFEKCSDRINRLLLNVNNDDTSNSPNNRQKCDDLQREIDILKSSEETLQQQVSFLQRLEDVQLKNFMSQQCLINCDNEEGDELENHSPLSSARSEKSATSQASAASLQLSLDVFNENNRLLESKKILEQKYLNEIALLKNQLNQLDDKLKESQDENFRLEELVLENDERNRRLFDEMTRKIDESQANVETLKNDITHSDVFKTLQNELESLKLELSHEKATSIDINNKYVSLQHEFLKTDSDLRSSKEEKEAITLQYNSVLKDKAALQSKIDELKTIRRNKEFEKLNSESLQSENVKLAEQLKVYKEKFQENCKQLESCLGELNIKLEENDHFKKLLIEKDTQSFRTDYELTKSSLQQMKKLNEELGAENSKLKSYQEAQNDLKRAFESQNLGIVNLKEIVKFKEQTIEELKSKVDQYEKSIAEYFDDKKSVLEEYHNLEEILKVEKENGVQIQVQFDYFKRNAQNQFEHACCKYEEKISDLHSILQQYTKYPGKESLQRSPRMTLSQKTQTSESGQNFAEIILLCLRKMLEILSFGNNSEFQDELDEVLKLYSKLVVNNNNDQLALEEFRFEMERVRIVVENINKFKENAENKIQSLQRDLDQCNNERSSVKDSLHKMNIDFELKSQEYTAKYADLHNRFENERQLGKSLKAKIDEQMCNFESKLETYRSDREKLEEKLMFSDSLQKQASETIKALSSQLKQTETNLHRRDQEAQQFFLNGESLQRKIATLNAELERLEMAYGCLLKNRDAKNINPKSSFDRLNRRIESLIDQKRYLIGKLENFLKTEHATLQFLQQNGFLGSANNIPLPRPSLKLENPKVTFRAVARAVWLVVMLRKSVLL